MVDFNFLFLSLAAAPIFTGKKSFFSAKGRQRCIIEGSYAFEVNSMISILPQGFNDFHCKAGACRHTCCQKWEIDIDDDTADYYRGLKTPLGKKSKTIWKKVLTAGISN